MNKKLPFEEAFERQMNNLQPQHEDESWQKMKQLLDEKDKRKPVAFFKTYKAIVILILLLLSGYWVFVKEKNATKEETVAAEKTLLPYQKPNTNKDAKAQISIEATNQQPADNAKVIHGNDNGNSSAKASSVNSNLTTGAQRKIPQSIEKTVNALAIRNKTKTKSELKNFPRSNQTSTAKAEVADIRNSNNENENKATGLSATLPASAGQKEVNDSISSNEKFNGDALTTKPKENLTAKENLMAKDSAVDVKTLSRRNAQYIVVSAGIGVQQQIPLAGQKTVAYGYNGTAGTLSDYIPSVYIRFEKDQKWFLQGEYIYGSPQLIKTFAYDKQTRPNNNTSTITTTTFRLKKTYYNEVPLSFNYYVRANWYAGIGGVYSWFHGAIAEKEILTNNVLTQAQTVSKQIVPIAGYTDSFLYKTHTYLLLQTSYNLGRLSAGLRYTRDIQPYIKYTLPDGTINDEKSWSLEFMLRFRLFKAARL